VTAQFRIELTASRDAAEPIPVLSLHATPRRRL
jgi:hypothetical protein